MMDYLTPFKKKPILPTVSFAICSLFLASCSSSNNGDTTTLPPDTTVLAKDTLLSVQVIDSNGDAVDAATVDITSDPDDIIISTEEKQLTPTDSSGLVTYAPNEFSGAKTIQIIASKDGFLANNIPFNVESGSANEATIVITNVDSNNAVGINATSASGDSLTTAITVTAKEGDDAEDSKTVVTIDADPGATTEDGTPLGNNINVIVAQYDHDEDQSLDAFPGGFSPSIENPSDLISDLDALPADGETPTDGTVVFESAGFTAIEVTDDEGNVAKNFNKPVEVSTKIKSDFINPMTGLAIVAGDTIPIWSFEASTGKWRYEKIGTVVADPDGGLKVDYTVTHLSYYNLDYFRGGRCDATVTFRDTTGATLALSGRVSSQGWSHTFKYPGDDVLTLRNAPSDRLVEFTSLKTVNGQDITVVSPTAPVNLCNEPTVVVVEPPAIEYSELTASAHSYCSNNDAVADEPISGTYIWIYSNNWRHIGSAKTDNSGETTFRLPVGTYKVFVYDPVSRDRIFNTVTLDSSGTATTALRVPQTCVITTGGNGTSTE